MATHSSVLAWRIPGTAEHGGLPSLGLHRVGHGLICKMEVNCPHLARSLGSRCRLWRGEGFSDEL